MLRDGQIVEETTKIKAKDVSNKYISQSEKGKLFIYHVNVGFDLVTKEPFESHLNKLIEANKDAQETLAYVLQKNQKQ